MRYLLDTNIWIALSKNNTPHLSNWLQHCPSNDIVLSSVVLAEIEYGIAKSQRREYNRQIFEHIIRLFNVVDFDAAAAKQYGWIRADLEQRGQLIGPNDMMIAAQALALNLDLITDNEKEFRRINGLRVENWLRQSP
ncbi:type II toxin-antitoxin system tRNA(fMet)-specific endonuclease VapC [Acinetobacter puyangensis]|uniref:type II toxin-antitoxin system tRNA(fMet)-specific endonuclease VapC n=1 Tax=Acinetobacter puyangensis TaxID=1096779 RepID=UPI003A4DBDD8